MANEHGKRKNAVTIYLSDEEKAVLTKAAEDIGLGLVPWIRMLAIVKAKEIAS